jgi:hypothetical protein
VQGQAGAWPHSPESFECPDHPKPGINAFLDIMREELEASCPNVQQEIICCSLTPLTYAWKAGLYNNLAGRMHQPGHLLQFTLTST